MSTDPSSGGLFSSVASDIKAYDGNDPLRPWLQGIRKLRSSLPPHILREKLPRFLQRCVQTFRSHRRYRNDSRYVGVWIQLMDFVDDPKALLTMMEENQIGTKRSAFYMAYAIFLEKKRKFAEAEKMYHLGVQKLAEPALELQKAYEQFLSRLDWHRKRKTKTEERREKLLERPDQREMIMKESESNPNGPERVQVGADNAGTHNQRNLKSFDATGGYSSSNELDRTIPKIHANISKEKSYSKDRHLTNCHREGSRNLGASGKKPSSVTADAGISVEHDIKGGSNMKKNNFSSGDDTVIVKFVGSAIVGESEAEDACHKGLVDPTTNMKEAMDAISSMFRDPLEIDFKVKRKLNKSNGVKQSDSGFVVFVDDDQDQVNFSHPMGKCATTNGPRIQSLGNHKPPNLSTSTGHERHFPVEQPKPSSGETFKILADDEDDESEAPENQDHLDMELKLKGPINPQIFFPKANATRTPSCVPEDTVIRRFVGSTIQDEPEIENACHHGLVDPTVNLQQAMEDINGMFGEPIDFVKPRRPNKVENQVSFEPIGQGFSILADDEMEEPQPEGPVLPISPPNSESVNGLFEPTIFTKEAMEDINALFTMPMEI